MDDRWHSLCCLPAFVKMTTFSWMQMHLPWSSLYSMVLLTLLHSQEEVAMLKRVRTDGTAVLLAKPKWHVVHSYVCITYTLSHTSVCDVNTKLLYRPRSPWMWMKWVVCEDALCKHSTQNTYVRLHHTKHSYIHCAHHYRTTSWPVSVLTYMHQMHEKVNYVHSTHTEIYHISCCSLTSMVRSRSRQSPWCVQKSDDELNAVCLCPRRDHRINIALIQRSVCCMLIMPHSFSCSLSLIKSVVVRLVRQKGERSETSKSWLDLTCWLS